MPTHCSSSDGSLLYSMTIEGSLHTTLL